MNKIIFWLTVYDEAGLEKQLNDDVDYGTFFEEAPCMNPNCAQIMGSVCDVKVEEISVFHKRILKWRCNKN